MSERTEGSSPDIGAEIEGDVTDMTSILGDTYRGELDRETTWRGRLDQTTSWAVTVMAAILTWAFSSPDNPHYIVLVGVLAVGLFLLIESRRYRDYDVYRSRVRLIQENLLAEAIDPSGSVERRNWRTELGEDYRTPTMKITLGEAVANRLRRIYFALLVVLLLAWLFRITAFAASESPLEAASVGALSGAVVLAVVGAFYAAVVAITLWPRERKAKGEFREDEKAGEWKDDGVD
ncbi:DUF2270 domain-containing protein [Natronococcus jeotgali]|uniref:DUF2270 domain-containing protein n=1 Tax=Natronococcus jeotgali DSM 18795 TaxID=1227498 RepID=L9XD42_9EURY|nr:DUF2270 domain-containing protein [Natronococcus jeotgali]ELY58523.1 hypothetical protein C492_11930 [Natronococcus jeotgali DSM 18795]